MIPYNGGPITPDAVAARVFPGKHAMVSFAAPNQLALVAAICQSFSLDNGAFSAWRKGKPISEWDAFYAWINEWRFHPGFDFALIPDVIDGSEEDNDALIAGCPYSASIMSPVWHLHESLERLDRLIGSFPRVAIGSSGTYAVVKTRQWWERMDEAMLVACDDRGRPRVKLHGLRMLDPEIISAFPLSSADSTNIARNTSLDTRWTGPYVPLSQHVRGIVIMDRIESSPTAEFYQPRELNMSLF